jgi:hypothetical protein
MIDGEEQRITVRANRRKTKVALAVGCQPRNTR